MLLSVGQPQTLNYCQDAQKPITEYSQVCEDVNDYASTIWMVTDEEVPFSSATMGTEIDLRGSDIERGKGYYAGSQIFINSDRVVINGKRNEVQLFSKTEINLSAVKSITIASGRSVEVTADLGIKLKSTSDVYINGSSNVSLVSDGDISNDAGENYTISAKKIFIGSEGDTSQPMVLGGQMAMFLDQLLTALNGLSVAFTPQPTPAAAAAIARIQTVVSTLLIDVKKKQGASFNSNSNFTA
jgi:hypothetical protein